MRILLLAGGSIGLAAVAAALGFYLAFVRDLPDIRTVEDYRPPLVSSVTDRHGQPIGEFFVERRRLTPMGEIPQHVVRAFIAAEDNAFFEHSGIDFQSILRAAWVNLRAGDKVEGASTITQQMVKGLLLTPERTFRRKVREIVLARAIEQSLTKQEILYLYLNQIYFGHGAYGIGEAARTYFGKQPAELTVSQAAQLAGLPKAPTHYSPLRNPERAEERRRYVLRRMLEERYIDQATYDAGVAEAPSLSERPWQQDFADAAYFTEAVRRHLFDTLGGELVLGGGLRIETSLDLSLQHSAVAALRKGLEDLDHRQGYRGVLRTVEADALPTTLAELAASNGLAPSEDAPAPEGWEIEDADPEALLREQLDEGPLTGVVVSVDAKADTARVAFGPTGGATVRVGDVSWARAANPNQRTQPVKEIEKILHVGDVAQFALVEAGEEELFVALHQVPQVQGGLLSIDVESGDVLALVGGYDFETSQFDRVTQARRQPGSAFKPLVYGAALSLHDDEGHSRYTPASIVHDRPKVYRDHRSGFVWKPKNYGREFYGPITLRRALAKSINTAAVHLCDEIGVGNVIRYARRLGIESPLEPSLGLALGTSGVSLLELTRAYAVYPAGGRRVVPRFIHRVTDREGNVLFENVPLGSDFEPEPGDEEAFDDYDDSSVASGPDDADAERAASPPPTGPEQLIPAEDAYLMADMLRAVVLEGTGRRVAKLGRPLSGKTGTTNDQADAWFVGFSPEIATGVWVGHDEIRFLGSGETGSRAAAPIWVDYMGAALERLPKRDFVPPSSIVFARVDRATGLLATRQSQETVFQAFIAGTEPTETADTRRTTTEALRNLREDSLSSDDGLQLMRMDTF